jgi:hypothetical protein
MALPAQQPLDTTDLPALSRLVDEVQASQRPRILRRANHDVAMLVPLAHAVPTPVPPNPRLDAVLATLPKDSVIARTAGIVHTDQPFPGYDEEQEQAAIAVAADIVAEWQR